MSDQRKGKVVINRTAMSGNARAFDSKVSAATGGRTYVSGGDVVINENVMTGHAVAEKSEVQATKDHETVIGEVPVGDSGKSDQAKSSGGDLTFDEDTFVLLVSGAGEGSAVFKKDVQLMEKLFLSKYFEMSDDNIFKVTFKPKAKANMIDNIKTEIDKIRKELEGSTDGRLIVYYSGHFDEDMNFRIGDNEGLDDFMSDETFSGILRQIEAKFMLLILDTCYAGLARMGAKGNGGAKHGVPIPQLWKLIRGQSGTKESKGGGGKHEKIVQWCSCKGTEEASYDEISLFTNAIDEAIRTPSLPAGTTHATVLQIHERIHVKDQTPKILPDHANDVYFKDYPKFAKLI